MADRIFIDGAAGTTGLEILDRLNGRSEFELIQLDAAHRKSAEARREALNEADIAILCLPDDAARDAVELLDPAKGTRIIDASSAHRTTEGWCYGFPELVGRERVADARRVSNPGCYPTGFLGLVAPLVREGLLPADWPFTVNAVSGYSGGGKAMIADFERDDAPGFRAYGYDLRHKHLPEMQARAGLEHSVLFAPAVVPVYRGMIVEVPLHLGAMAGEPHADDLRASLADFYTGSSVVSVRRDGNPSELVLQREAEPWDGMELFVFGNEGGSNARLVARLDNLGKGASGAAIQNLNLMCGLPETTGLSP
ncbi:N-acetyl-gamma-glutamyl-phosphate reductase [Erythrobacter sp. HI0063]|jgi:N-acetyl-gamma-glutamyl-phosphate reductase|uniref:N-acetyl-gamma-glutamyl-phosphate reductase n=1 Tax=Erythrobacter sp. HI0063 TaxID=1822240 RepID=UPI0007C3F029|nr:N-acetyl-gamma-glutamyl-phosphate reductase [Erythrobacter sp. HI0063]KZY55719.1 N-acetyl-gamma-glutamyl-phosphate reductase [Erythrobacter sp. HI0063]